LSNWTVLGGVLELQSGRYQFTDPQTTNDLQRFYQIIAP